MRPAGIVGLVFAALAATACGSGSPKPAAQDTATVPRDRIATDQPSANRLSASGRGRAAAAQADPSVPATPAAAATPAAPATPTTAAAVAGTTPPPAHPIPASFRESGISPGAPSDAQVRAELQQMYAAEAHARKLSADAANFAGLLPWVAEQKTGERVSVASVFRDYGLGLACGGVLGVDQIGVAHKTAPCGTLIDFTYGGRTLRVPVIDRGPYIVGREWDLTGATAAALGFPGLGPITWRCASC